MAFLSVLEVPLCFLPNHGYISFRIFSWRFSRRGGGTDSFAFLFGRFILSVGKFRTEIQRVVYCSVAFGPHVMWSNRYPDVQEENNTGGIVSEEK